MSTKYTESEYERYLGYISSNGIDYKNIYNIDEYIKDIKSIKKDNGDNISLNTQKIYLVATEWYIQKSDGNKDYIEPLKKEISKLYDEIDTEIKKHMLSEKQEKNYIDWQDILTVYNKLKKNYTRCQTSYKTFIILSLYILMPPRRLKDYCLMDILDNNMEQDPAKNYYNPLSGQFIFNNYKTKKYYDSQHINISDELNNLLLAYISKYNIIGSLLKLDRDGLRSRLLRIFRKELGKDASVNILRHSYISYMKDSGLMTGNEHIISQMMAHSVSMQCDYYKKIEK